MSKESEQLNGLVSIIEAGYSVQFKHISKRMDHPEFGRDWYLRYCWFIAEGGSVPFDCDWEGFETVEECIADLIKTMKELPDEISE